jgi:uncharacterized protein (DUF1330 family)
VSAYLLASYRITNPEPYGEYPPKAVPTILEHGGEVLAADFEGDVLEGQPQPVNVVIRFPSKDAARQWYDSDEYQKIIGLRTDNTEGTMVLVDEFQMPQG